MKKDIRRFSMLKNKSGVTALAFAAMLVPMVLLAGLGVDIGRAYLAQQWLQSAVDGAAMAGASAFTDPTRQTVARGIAQDFLTRGLASPPAGVTINAGSSIQMTPGTGCSANQASTVQVSATATVATTLMHAMKPSIDISAGATGAMPLVELNVTVNNLNFNLNAGDFDTVYWYLVPTDGSNPVPSDLIYILSNSLANTNNVPLPYSYSSTSSAVPCVFLTQKIGFGFSNELCERSYQVKGYSYYYMNSYGGTCTYPASVTKYYYSTLFPPTLTAYPTYTCCDFVLQISDVNSSGGDVQGLITSTFSNTTTPTWTVPASWSVTNTNPNDTSWAGMPATIPLLFPSNTTSWAPWVWGGFSAYTFCGGCEQISNPSFNIYPPQPAPGKGYFDAAAEPLGQAMNSDGSITCYNLMYGNPATGSTYQEIHVYWNDGGPTSFWGPYAWVNYFPYNSEPINKYPWSGAASWDAYSYNAADFNFTCNQNRSGKASAYLTH